MTGIEKAKEVQSEVQLAVKPNQVLPEGTMYSTTDKAATVSLPSRIYNKYKPFVDGKPNTDFVSVIIACMTLFGTITIALLVAMVSSEHLPIPATNCAQSA